MRNPYVLFGLVLFVFQMSMTVLTNGHGKMPVKKGHDIVLGSLTTTAAGLVCLLLSRLLAGL